MDDPFAKVHSGIKQFNATLDRLFARQCLQPYQLSGLVFAQDTAGASYKPPGFMIERKHGLPFEDNRYWCKAPFTTTDHINALEELEKILTS